MNNFRSTPVIAALLISIYLFQGCSKPNDIHPAATDSTVVISSLAGNLYVFVNDSMQKMDVATGNTIWKSKARNFVGSAQSSVNFDNEFIYRGNSRGMTCYNSTDGSVAWFYDWSTVGYSGTLPSHDYPTVFKDSLVYFASMTTGVWRSTLYCANKYSGAIKWQQQLDFSYGIGAPEFHKGVPVISGNNIIILGQDINADKKIFCFNGLSGQLVWETQATSETMMANIKISGDKLYVTGQKVFCHDVNTGNLLWQSDISLSNFNSTFIEADKLIIIGKDNTLENCEVRVLNKNTGVIITTYSLPQYYQACSFKNNVLYLSLTDTNILKAININTGTEIWNFSSQYLPGIVTIINPNSLLLEVSSAVITTNEVIVTEALSYDNVVKSSISFLDFNGNLVKSFNFNQFGLLKHFIYTNGNIVYKNDEF